VKVSHLHSNLSASRRTHDLRHSCASFLIAAGASPRTVMKTLGHSQISLTMNTYAYVLPEVERAAVDAAAQVLFGAQPDDWRSMMAARTGCTRSPATGGVFELLR